MVDPMMERIVAWYAIGGGLFMFCYVVLGVPFYIFFVRG